jgi:hypothetical protein
MSAVAGCTVPFDPPNARAFDPPAEFATLWIANESCAQTSGDWTRVHWFRVPWLPDNLEGAWDLPHRVFLTDFVLSDAVSPEYREYVVRHEMLHDLLQTAEHPPAFTACGVP